MRQPPGSYYKEITMHRYINVEWWIGFLTALTGWVSSLLFPTWPFVGVVAFLVTADLFTGLKAARKLKQPIRSRGLKRTVEKIALYFVAILSSELVKVVFIPMVPVTYITGFAIALTEFKSIIENVEIATGVNIWHYLRDRLNMNINKNNDEN